MMIRAPLKQKTKIVLGISSVVVLIIAYSILSYRQHILFPKNTTMPSIQQMAYGFYEICVPDPLTGKIVFWEDLKASSFRLFAGMLISIIMSVVVGILMGCYEFVEAIFIVPLSIAAKIPPTAMIVIFMILAGTDTYLFLTLIGFGTAPVLTQSIFQAAKFDVHDELIQKAYTLGGSEIEIVINIVFRQTLPRIIEAIRLQMGPAMVYLIAAELALANVGFGYTIGLDGKKQDFDIVYPYCIMLGFIGLFLDFVLIRARQYCCPWFDKE